MSKNSKDNSHRDDDGVVWVEQIREAVGYPIDPPQQRNRRRQDDLWDGEVVPLDVTPIPSWQDKVLNRLSHTMGMFR